MSELLTIITVAATAFIGTNLDNLLLLVAWHTHYREHPSAVTAGYVAGMLLIGGICVIVGQLGELVPIAYLGLLGFIPVTLGVRALVRLVRDGAPRHASGDASADNTARSVFTVLLMTQLSHSADTIIAFSVLLADSNHLADQRIMPVFLAMVACFAWLARHALQHRGLSSFLGRYGGYATPFILILVGIYVISNTATDLMPG